MWLQVIPVSSKLFDNYTYMQASILPTVSPDISLGKTRKHAHLHKPKSLPERLGVYL